VLDIVNTHMMGAVRVISVEQGEDPREFTLVAFGGAGPLHAADIARAMGMRRVLVPPRPGLLSAMGLLHADVRGDFSMTRLLRAQPMHLPAINEGFAELYRRGNAWLAGEQIGQAPVTREWLMDLRYVGQNSELILGTAHYHLDGPALARLLQAFHQRHQGAYGYDMPDQPVEIVNLRLVVTVTRPAPPPERGAPAEGRARAVPEQRRVWFPEAGFVATPVYHRDLLPADTTLNGPCIIEQMDTTTVVPPQATLRVDAYGYLHLDVAPSRVQEEATR
jgi:N-methylhydantoinase A